MTKPFVLVLTGLAVLATSCGAESSPTLAGTDPGAGASVPAQESPTTTSSTTTWPPFETHEEWQAHFESTNQLPIRDGNDDVIGWSRTDIVLSPEGEPDVAEVYSYDTGEVVGYRVRWVGYVDLNALDPSLPPIDAIEALHGDTLAASHASAQEFDELVASLPPGELARLIEENYGE